jgi:hypothetical protein
MIAERHLSVGGHDDLAIAAYANYGGGADAISLSGILCRRGTVH